ncbi:hypothetical protein, partial [Staphylococcus muscae]
STKEHVDAIYGKSLLLSIYIGVNRKKKTRTGHYSFSNNSNRIALKSSVLTCTDATEKEIEFYNYVKENETVSYSNKIAMKYNIMKYLWFYFITPEEEKIDYPKCTLYYKSELL